MVAQKVATALQESMTEYDISIDASLITLTRKSSDSVTPSVFSASTTGVVCTITDSTKREFRNILMPNMINQPNTIYEIRYNFDLDGKTITIPNNCVLYFTSGKFYNGSISMDNTIVSTLYEDILLEVNISGNYYNIQKYIEDTKSLFQANIDKLNDTVYPITLGFNVSPNVVTMNTSINYSVVSSNKPLIPDVMKISKQVNNNTAIVLLDTPASNGNLTTNIEGSREIFKFEVTKTGRTGKSTSITRYLCYYGSLPSSTIYPGFFNSLTKVSTGNVYFNPTITNKDGEHLFLVVPDYLNIKRVTSAGFNVTMADPVLIANQLGTFKVYITANPLTPATWNLVIS